MSYVKSNLTPGERLVYETRLHWIVMLGHMFFALVLLIGSGALFYYAASDKTLEPGSVHTLEGGGIALLVGAGVALLAGAIRRNATEIAVTSRRVVVKTGIAGRRTIEMMLDKIESIEVAEPAFGRMLGYGTITVIGTGGTLEPFHKIAHPLEFRSHVQQQIEKQP